MPTYPNLRSPLATVDIIIETKPNHIVLVERANPPQGWALPGGFVDYGESLWQAAMREAKEETSLVVELSEQFYSYSDPQRDTRCHTITTVFLATASGDPAGRDDAARAKVFEISNLPQLVFDHNDILRDYLLFQTRWVKTRAGSPLL